MGHGYKGGTETHHSVEDNINTLVKQFDFSEGYFGQKGDSSNSHVRHIETEDPLLTAHEFYDTFGYGGIEQCIGEGKWKTVMEDGTIIVMREVSNSKDGSPAVDINVQNSKDSQGIKSQKIHFVLKGGK